jgi:hypothetical protein
VYAHWIPDASRREVDRLDAMHLDAHPAQPAALVEPGMLAIEFAKEKMVSQLGIEPRTRRLRVCCSAN